MPPRARAAAPHPPRRDRYTDSVCGRFTHLYTWAELHALMELLVPYEPGDGDAARTADLPRSYNVAPTQRAPVVRRLKSSGWGIVLARWGLIPSWAKDAKIGASTINARAETVSEKPAFRAAFKRGRCVVPASGFYEWKKLPDGTKRPMHIYRVDGKPLLLAGLHERWNGPDGEVESFTIITTDANDFMREIHDRMPVVLEPETVETWLNPDTPTPRLEAMLAPAADGVLAAHAVSTRVNSPRNNDEDVCRPVSE